MLRLEPIGRDTALEERWVESSEANMLRYGLTPRERDVARLVIRGLANKEIAWELGTSDQTIKNHLQHSFDKLRVGDRTQLALRLIGVY